MSFPCSCNNRTTVENITSSPVLTINLTVNCSTGTV